MISQKVASHGSFNPNSPIGSVGISAVILVPTDTSEKAQCVTGANWKTGTKGDQSAYRSELGGIIVGLTIIDAVVRYKNISAEAVKRALYNDSAIDENKSNSLISISNKSFDFIQVIKTWIKDLPINVKFRYISGHQLNHRQYKDFD